MLINSVLCVAIIGIMYYSGAPLIYDLLPEPWSGIVTAFVTLFFCAPFIWALLRRGADSKDVDKLWDEGGNLMRVKITAFGILRLAIGAAFIAFIIGNTLPKIGMYGIFAVIGIAFLIFISPYSKARSDKLTKTFTENLNVREHQQ